MISPLQGRIFSIVARSVFFAISRVGPFLESSKRVWSGRISARLCAGGALIILKFSFLFAGSAGKSSTKGRSKGKEGAVVDEELYNIDDGWNIELDVTQKARCLSVCLFSWVASATGIIAWLLVEQSHLRRPDCKPNRIQLILDSEALFPYRKLPY